MISRGKAEKQAARQQRLSAELRENLKRRKAQARSRADADGRTREADILAEDKVNRLTSDFRRNRGRD